MTTAELADALDIPEHEEEEREAGKDPESAEEQLGWSCVRRGE